MIEHARGDILTDSAEALVNTVNCVGHMGRGIALQFKRRFPENFKAYKKACDHEEVVPGRMHVFSTGTLTPPRYIINFPTKRHWRAKSRMSDVEEGLRALVSDVRRLGIRTIAIPPLGCGLGGLDWGEVRPRIEAAFADASDVTVRLYEPAGAPPVERASKSAHEPAMTPGRAVLLALMDRYLAGLMEPWVTLLEVHKLMYFAQEAGEALRLEYVEGPYGPYAENLRHVLATIEGHMVLGYADGGDEPTKQLEIMAGQVQLALRCLGSHAATTKRLERVTDLVAGFESPFGLELLASVHWIARSPSRQTEHAIVQALHAWNARKQQFDARHVKIALQRLAQHGWLEVERVMPS